MTTTRVVKSRDLARQESIQFIRGQTLRLNLIESRPNTKLYVFFGGEDVTRLCFPTSSRWFASTAYAKNSLIKHNDLYYRVSVAGTTGTVAPTHASGTATNGTAQLTKIDFADIFTDQMGQAEIDLNIPGGRFNTGTVEIIVTDAYDLQLTETAGSTYGTAVGYFSAVGTLEIIQPKEVTITTVTRIRPVSADPLAQSFFTYGVKDGLFVTSIDIFFQTKDPSMPVRCELREMVNGYPSPTEAGNTSTVSILSPAYVNVSLDASVPSKFIFNPPVYLEAERDYCFVLRSNSNQYNVFTSRMGETSIEDGRKIYDNPFVGSVFKSENDITWTADQFEDIKFTINKAVFDTSAEARIVFDADIPPLSAMGDQFTTVSGSNEVTYRHAQEHGLEVGSIFHLIAHKTTAYANANYNGLLASDLEGSHVVTSTPDRNTLTIQVNGTATTTGAMETAKVVTYVGVISGGINYSASDTVVFTGGGGSGATATLNINNGQIIGINVTNGGSGYTSAPTVSVVSTTGSGASLLASVLPTFTVYVNKPMSGVLPYIAAASIGASQYRTRMKTTIGNFDGGNLVTYSAGADIPIKENQTTVNIGQHALIASKFNEAAMMGGSKSARIEVSLSTNNPNVSPIINLNKPAELHAYSNKINSQVGQDINSINATGSIENIAVTSAGSGYTVDPIVVIDPPHLPGGVQATATAVRSSTAVGQIVITNPGSGYTSPPLVTIVRGVGDVTGNGATAQAALTSFNTERLPVGGTAKTRYITKKTSLQIISTGARLYSVISSVVGSSVDWYIRTSLSGTEMDHDQLEWVPLKCNTERNKSTFSGDFREYVFELDNLDPFDTYDLKCVMTARDPLTAPIIKSYRLIVVA